MWKATAGCYVNVIIVIRVIIKTSIVMILMLPEFCKIRPPFHLSLLVLLLLLLSLFVFLLLQLHSGSF